MRDRLAWAGLPAAVVLLLAGAVAWNPDAGLDIAEADPSAARAVEAVLDALPDGADILVGFDPDLGTYAEVRPTVRALLDDLLDRGASLRVVSLTPEGRALAVAEMARLGTASIEDLGFVPGSEAALVELAGALAETPADLAIVIGGNDIGPRSWVEQVVPRTDGLPIVAVTPAALLPEVEPYRESGQLAALLATPREGAAYRATVAPEIPGPPATAVAIGLVVALAWLAAGLVGGARPWLRSLRGSAR